MHSSKELFEAFGGVFEFEHDIEFDADGRLLHYKTKLTEVIESMKEKENLMKHEIEYMISESL